jgi:hypothetical protein
LDTNHPSSAQNGDLDPSEWDFRKTRLPTSQIEPCFVYEHARELVKRSNRLAAIIAKWKAPQGISRKIVRPRDAPGAHSDAMKLLSECFDMSFTFDQHFPDTPWLCLPRASREAIKRAISDERLSIFSSPLAITLLGKGENIEQRFKVFRALHWHFRRLNRTRYGFIAVDFHHSDAAIKRTFEKWLSNRRIGRVQSDAQNRSGLRDELNRLAALRLLEHYGAKRLLKEPDNRASGIKFSDSPYHHLSDLYRARAKAEKLLNTLATAIDGI